jgi:hypothetical protein
MARQGTVGRDAHTSAYQRLRAEQERREAAQRRWDLALDGLYWLRSWPPAWAGVAVLLWMLLS